jgi:very-short-patch-repair endonuclease
MLYSDMSEEQKKQAIKKMYTDQRKSFAEIAEEYNTYPNKIRRDANKWNIKARNKSDAQKNAISTGKHKHPTKGQQRSESVKQKIGKSVLKSWEDLSEKDLLSRKTEAKKRWESKSEDDKQNILHLANMAVRETSKTGSKLEKFIFTKLIADGYRADFHKEQVLSNTKLQIDLFLPTINTAIEIDGPSHFLPVWGHETLKRNKTYDKKKHGLILGKGWKLIRIKQTKDFSKTRAELIYEKLSKIILSIPNNNTSSFNIEDQ